MSFDGTLADLEVRGYILARVTGEDHFHDFVLPRGEERETPVGVFLEAEELAYQFVPLTQYVTLQTLRLSRLFNDTMRKDAARQSAI